MNFINLTNNVKTEKWEVRIIEDDQEKVLAQCNTKKDCYKEMTNYLVSLGIKKGTIRYQEHPAENYLIVSSVGDFHFRLYNI